jgi:hypothetical protein
MDVKRLARFRRPGHALTGVRDATSAENRAGVGYDYLHVVIDDHTRLAYVELHGREDKHTNTRTLERAFGFFAEPGSHRLRPW